MAKKSKKSKGKKSGTSRRRGRSRVGALGGVSMEALAGVAAGAVASKALNGVTRKIKIVQDKPIILPVAKAGLGYLMIAKSKNSFVQNMGFGFIAEGVLQGLEVGAPDVFKKLAGGPVSDVNGIGTTYIDLDDISGTDSMNIDHGVAGVEDDMLVAGLV